MIKFEHTEVYGWEAAIRGMRNPMNSWAKSDSGWDLIGTKEDDDRYLSVKYDRDFEYNLGPNDRDLMMRLRNAGTDHRKFMRMIIVTVDITAPSFWWAEMDTYKVGTVRNSTSTMHKIHSRELTHDDFSCEDLLEEGIYALDTTIDTINRYRKLYLETKDKRYWRQIILLLPRSYNYRSTVQMNYEVLANMYKSRRSHKLDEWSVGFVNWVKGLPYSELITGEKGE